ncbi:hypothetical protein N7528_007549 [Penicillium herquei]|nr:hypothetical protein N7528_007549 [Penicillium herquei]
MATRNTGFGIWNSGNPAELPPPRQGQPGAIEEPGQWALVIQALDFGPARQEGRFKSDLLIWLTRQTPRREPVLRLQFNYTATYFLRMLNGQIANIEAAYMQIVGEECANPCDSCLALQRPFNVCVRLPTALSSPVAPIVTGPRIVPPRAPVYVPGFAPGIAPGGGYGASPGGGFGSGYGASPSGGFGGGPGDVPGVILALSVDLSVAIQVEVARLELPKIQSAHPANEENHHPHLLSILHIHLNSELWQTNYATWTRQWHKLGNPSVHGSLKSNASLDSSQIVWMMRMA